ncbi:unnamed protein product [Urochloa humidicola]
MESNTLLPVEEARKVKAIVVGNNVPSMCNGGRELNPSEEPNADWRMVLHGSSQEAVHCPEAADHQKGIMSVSHGIVGLDVECVVHDHHLEVPGKSGGINFSNSSSLVTSLGNSREGSPERLGLSMLYGNQQPNAVSLASMSPWMPMPVPTAQHVVSHFPVFAAWADA